MNWRRGFFRLWVLFAGLWIVGTVIVGLNYPAPFFPKTRYYFPEVDADPVAVGLYSDDFYQLERLEAEGSAVAIEIDGMPEATVFVKPGLESNEVSRRRKNIHAIRLRIRAAIEKEHRADKFRSLIVGGIAPPLIVLLFGSALGWVMGGFQKTPK